ncbi:hypothetical protein DFAR_1310006 [Desulfarculales bacterium]
MLRNHPGPPGELPRPRDQIGQDALDREGSQFTLLFEQVVMTLVREMPVPAAARIIGVSNMWLWRMIQLYVVQILSKMDLGGVKSRFQGSGACLPFEEGHLIR